MGIVGSHLDDGPPQAPNIRVLKDAAVRLPLTEVCSSVFFFFLFF